MKKIVLSILILFTVNSWAFASANNDIPDDAVKFFMKIARESITAAVVSDGSHIPPETIEEKKKEIIPFSDAKDAVAAGRNSSLLEWCGLDAQSNYKAFMRFQRAKAKWSDKQLAYFSLIHGVTQGYLLAKHKEDGECPDKTRLEIESKLSSSKSK